MCTPTETSCKFVELAFDPVFQFVKRHVGHLTNYRDNLRKLEDELRKLDEKKNEVRGEVHEAEVRGRVIDVKVTEWLDAVDGVMQGVMDFTTDETHKENVSCFKLSCPHIIWRYKLSKQALGKIDGVQDFINKGNYFSEISHPAPPPLELQFPSASNYERFGSREKVFESIVVALKDPHVKMIGVYGAGGIGKTTMVETIGKKLKEDGTFDEVVLATVSQVVNVEQIQKRIASLLSPPPEGHGAQQLTERLRNVRKNLIILDDVWHDLNLMEIGIPLVDGNSKGCKVVMTSRNLEVRDKNIPVDRKFSLPILEDTEAWALFITKVGGSVESDFELRDVAKAVCQECRGLPVAIATVGAALKGKEMYVWLNALKQLKKSIIDKKVYNCLKLSYDSLELDQAKDAQTCFLLCCFFPEDAEIPIDDLMRHCMAKRLLVQDPDTIQEARLAAYVAVDTLKTRCLLLQGRDEHFVKVHDVIRDFSISMAKDDEKIAFLVNHNLCEWPERGSYERYSALCLRSKNFGEIPNQLACPQLHTLMLDCVYHPPEFRNGFFRGMKTLTVLELYQWHMAVLSPSFTELVNLRMLTLDGCHVEDITRLKDLKSNVEMLNFRGSYIQSLPPEIGELTRLRLLDMRDCQGLELIPQGVISKLTRLEELYIPDEFTKWEASTAANREGCNASLGELMPLKRLTTLSIHIPDVALLPKDLCFDNLVNFDISVGSQTRFYGGVRSKCSLELACIPFRAQFNILLEKAELVHLRRVTFLKTLQNDSGGRVGFLKLKALHVEYCDDIEHLFGKTNWFVRREELINLSSPAPFGKLTKLNIFNSSFKYLFSPSCAMGLQQLERLWISECVMMEEIVGTEAEPTNYTINFSRLKYLRLVSLPKLISFYPKMEKTATKEGNSSSYAQSLFNEKLAFPALEILEILKLSRITEIWDKTLFPSNSFCQLTEMRVNKCYKLKNLLPASMVPQLKNLRVVKVNHCRKMEVIISEINKRGPSVDIIQFPQLQILHLEFLKKLEGFISKPQIFFIYQVTLPKLEKLHLVNCANFERCIFGMLHGSLNLRVLVVGKCGGVREVFHLDDGDGQQVGLLTEVTVIALHSLPQLTCLWNKDPHGIVGLGNLRHIMIENCPNLRNLFSFSVATALKQLKILFLDSCEMMEEVIATNEGLKQAITGTELVFPMLKFLILLNLPNFKRLCSANCTLNSPSLRNVVVKRCPKMQTYPLGIVQSPQIKVLIDDKEIQLKDLNKYLEQQVLNKEECSMMDENWRGNILELIEYNNSDMDDGITSDSDCLGSGTSDSDDEYDKAGQNAHEADDTPSVA